MSKTKDENIFVQATSTVAKQLLHLIMPYVLGALAISLVVTGFFAYLKSDDIKEQEKVITEITEIADTNANTAKDISEAGEIVIDYNNKAVEENQAAAKTTEEKIAEITNMVKGAKPSTTKVSSPMIKSTVAVKATQSAKSQTSNAIPKGEHAIVEPEEIEPDTAFDLFEVIQAQNNALTWAHNQAVKRSQGV